MEFKKKKETGKIWYKWPQSPPVEGPLRRGGGYIIVNAAQRVSLQSVSQSAHYRVPPGTVLASIKP